MASTWNDWKETTMNLARAGAAKAREVGEGARIRLDTLGEEETLRRLYLEIGKLYLTLHRDDPEEPFEELFRQVAESRQKIRDNEDKLDNLRRQEGGIPEDGEWIPCGRPEGPRQADQEASGEPIVQVELDGTKDPKP